MLIESCMQKSMIQINNRVREKKEGLNQEPILSANYQLAVSRAAAVVK